MKYTILGLNQQGLIALDLDLVDTHIVRYMIDFHSTGKMKKCEIEGKSFFWVHYQSVIDELPILYMKKQAVKRRLDKIGNCGLVEKHVDKTGQGTYTYFRFIESVLTRLLSSGNGGTNNGGGCLERRLPVAPKGNPKTLLLKETLKEPFVAPTGATKKTSSKFSEESEAYRTGMYLLLHIRKHKPDYKTPNLQEWARHADLMLRVDGRNLDTVKDVIKWAHSDGNDFERKNVLSTKKLRARFDHLEMSMNTPEKKPSWSQQPEGKTIRTEPYDIFKNVESDADRAARLGRKIDVPK